MSAEKLRRVIWRLREKNKSGTYGFVEVRAAIYEEIGTDRRTLKVNLEALINIMYLKRLNRWQYADNGCIV